MTIKYFYIIAIYLFLGCSDSNSKDSNINIYSDLKRELDYLYFERDFFQDIRKAKHYLEFGCGGSTTRAFIKSECQITSVESGKVGIEELRKYKIVRKAEKRNRLRFIGVDIGAVGNRGFPIDGSSRHSFPCYSAKVFQYIRTDDVDCVLIDGRFRIACALQVILKQQESGFDYFVSRYMGLGNS